MNVAYFVVHMEKKSDWVSLEEGRFQMSSWNQKPHIIHQLNNKHHGQNIKSWHLSLSYTWGSGLLFSTPPQSWNCAPEGKFESSQHTIYPELLPHTGSMWRKKENAYWFRLFSHEHNFSPMAKTYPPGNSLYPRGEE